MVWGVSEGVLNWSPLMQRDASLSDSYTSDRCCFSSQDWGPLRSLQLTECDFVYNFRTVQAPSRPQAPECTKSSETLQKIFRDILHTERWIYKSCENQMKFRLWYHFSVSFDTKQISVWLRINRKSAITIKVWFNITRFRNVFFLYIYKASFTKSILTRTAQYQKLIAYPDVWKATRFVFNIKTIADI